MRERALAFGVLLALALSGPTAAQPALGAWCINHDVPFSIPYPATWWVHPPDPARDVAECERFGPAPFELEQDETLVWVGESITAQLIEGCIGSFWQPASTQARIVGGLEGTRIEYLPTVGAEHPTYPWLVYFVRLSPTNCEEPGFRVFSAGTTGGFLPPVGDDDTNKAILDAMMAGLQFTSTPDTAVELPRAASPLTVVGLALLTMAGALLVRRPRPIG